MKKFLFSITLIFLIIKEIHAHVDHYKNYNYLEYELFRNNKSIGYHIYKFTRNKSDLAKVTGEEINEITSEDFPRMTLIFWLSLFSNNTLENDKAIINKK